MEISEKQDGDNDSLSETMEAAAELSEKKPPSLKELISQLSSKAEDVAESSGEIITQTRLQSLVGKTIDGRYQVLSKVGQGGMGVVYKARHVILDRLIALKVLNPAFCTDEVALKRFLREARMVSKLSHPNAISLYEFGVEEDLPYLVMEYAEGKTLFEVIDKVGPLPLNRANEILQQVCSALQSAHDLGIVHRDLKPENIMLSERPNGEDWARVLDFGIAKIIGTSGTTATKLSTASMPCGTPHYMAPELFAGDTFDGRADVYALGIILFQMLCGETPFDRDSIVQILFKQMHEPIPLLRDLRPDLMIPASIEDIICKAVEKDPSARFASVQKFAEELECHASDAVDKKNSLSKSKRLQKAVSSINTISLLDRRLFNITVKFHLQVWLTIGLLVVIIWPLARYRYEIRVFLGAPILRAEDHLGFRLSPLRAILKIDETLNPKILFEYCSNGSYLDSLEMVLNAGVDPAPRDSKRQTPLHYAIEHDYSEGAELLLDAGADTTAQDEQGITPLHIAAVKNQAGMIYSLVKHKAGVDTKNR